MGTVVSVNGVLPDQRKQQTHPHGSLKNAGCQRATEECRSANRKIGVDCVVRMVMDFGRTRDSGHRTLQIGFWTFHWTRQSFRTCRAGGVKELPRPFCGGRMHNQGCFQGHSFPEGARKTDELVSICLLLPELSDYNPMSFP
jgi:hypothetical protein